MADKMNFVEMVARALCLADCKDPEFPIIPGYLQWRKYEATATIVGTIMVEAQKNSKVPSNDS